jgi:bifunctional non-homologous end joining protein LigD
MHLYVPLEPVYEYDQVRTFAEAICRTLARQHPKLFTLPRALASRTKGRIYFDWMQIGRGKTISAPYVVRPRQGALVATPLDWSEVKRGLKPQAFHLRNANDRFRRTGDLFAGVLRHMQQIEPALEKLSGLIKGASPAR